MLATRMRGGGAPTGARCLRGTGGPPRHTSICSLRHAAGRGACEAPRRPLRSGRRASRRSIRGDFRPRVRVSGFGISSEARAASSWQRGS